MKPAGNLEDRIGTLCHTFQVHVSGSHVVNLRASTSHHHERESFSKESSDRLGLMMRESDCSSLTCKRHSKQTRSTLLSFKVGIPVLDLAPAMAWLSHYDHSLDIALLPDFKPIGASK